MSEKPEALRLAEWIESDMTCDGDAQIAAELRRLHAQRAALLEALKLARPYINTYALDGYRAEAKADAVIKAVEEKT